MAQQWEADEHLREVEQQLYRGKRGEWKRVRKREGERKSPAAALCGRAETKWSGMVWQGFVVSAVWSSYV